MKFTARVLKAWLPLAALATLLVGLTYVAVQQAYRSSANDPQIQMAEYVARLLDGGATIDAVLPGSSVDIASSLAPFMIIFGKDGIPVESNASLHDFIPAIPLGALEASRTDGENRVTWQPEAGVRVASVIVPFSGGYVLAGRSLLEVESRVDRLTTMLGSGWLVTLAATFLLVLALETFIKPSA